MIRYFHGTDESANEADYVSSFQGLRLGNWNVGRHDVLSCWRVLQTLLVYGEGKTR